ncbi:MAG: class I SAM-dependent methyltransferase [Desulfovibrio sp.]|jgi:SAM-dependent methyltransferase|nr:class I SAM-dependent methyltransferase [Desulfovibrio sp.]
MPRVLREIKKDSLIASLLPAHKNLNIFEVSAGGAHLARTLRDMGHVVTISNLHSYGHAQYGLEEHEIDINLPDVSLPKAPFDAILCREVIEHVENIPHALRIFERHLKPQGVVILTLPNRLCLRSRLYYLLTGFYRGMPKPINLKYPLGEEHINLVGYPELEYFLTKSGLTITSAQASEIDMLDNITLCLLPLFWISTHYFLLKHKSKLEGYEVETDADIKRISKMRDALLSRDLFIGKDLVIAAQKSGESG